MPSNIEREVIQPLLKDHSKAILPILEGHDENFATMIEHVFGTSLKPNVDMHTVKGVIFEVFRKPTLVPPTEVKVINNAPHAIWQRDDVVSPDEAKAFISKFGLVDGVEKTYARSAKQLDLSYSQVNYRVLKAQKKLRNNSAKIKPFLENPS